MIKYLYMYVHVYVHVHVHVHVHVCVYDERISIFAFPNFDDIPE